jgi:hypothetical protein
MVPVCAFLAWAAYRFGQSVPPPTTLSTAPRIEDVRRIARLAVLRVEAADVIEGTTAGAKALVLVKGDADLTIDLEQIEIAERDDAAKRITLLLPSPRPDRPRVDQARTRVYELRKTGLAAFNPFADPRPVLLEDCMRAAQAAVEKVVQDGDFVGQAKQRVEQLLAAFHRDLGWEVTVRWRGSSAG